MTRLTDYDRENIRIRDVVISEALAANALSKTPAQESDIRDALLTWFIGSWTGTHGVCFVAEPMWDDEGPLHRPSFPTRDEAIAYAIARQRIEGGSRIMLSDGTEMPFPARRRWWHRLLPSRGGRHV